MFFRIFLRQALQGAVPLAKSFKGQHGAQTQTSVCRNLNHNACSRRRAMGVGTQESLRRRATVVGTMLVHATVPPNGRGYLANPPTCGPLLILSPALKRWEPSKRQGLCHQSAHLWAMADFVPRFEALGTPKRQGLCSQSAHLWATSEFVPRFIVGDPPKQQGLCSQCTHVWATSDFVLRCEALGNPPNGRDYVANPPTRAPLLILSSAVKCWGAPKQKGLCSQSTHLRATSDFVPCFEALGTPQMAGLSSEPPPPPLLWAMADFVCRSEGL